MKKFSQEQIIQFLYGEASPILKMAIDKALQTDEELANEIKKLKNSANELNELKGKSMSPSKKTIDSILDYAKKTNKK